MDKIGICVEYSIVNKVGKTLVETSGEPVETDEIDIGVCGRIVETSGKPVDT